MTIVFAVMFAAAGVMLLVLRFSSRERLLGRRLPEREVRRYWLPLSLIALTLSGLFVLMFMMTLPSSPVRVRETIQRSTSHWQQTQYVATQTYGQGVANLTAYSQAQTNAPAEAPYLTADYVYYGTSPGNYHQMLIYVTLSGTVPTYHYLTLTALPVQMRGANRTLTAGATMQIPRTATVSYRGTQTATLAPDYTHVPTITMQPWALTSTAFNQAIDIGITISITQTAARHTPTPNISTSVPLTATAIANTFAAMTAPAP